MKTWITLISGLIAAIAVGFQLRQPAGRSHRARS